MHSRKMTLLASVGAGLEYYDFVIYGLLASYIGKAFFPTDNHVVALLEAFSIFALGYVARPIGGIILGNLGDKIGRKPIFLLSLLLMAFVTLLIGLLPTYQHIGVWATVGIIILRILQGIAFGSEVPGTITFVIEHTETHQRGTNTGFALSSISLGASLGTGLIFVLTEYLTPDQMLSFGWRIPFILGGGLALVSFYIRRKLLETPAFLAYQHDAPKIKHQPIVELLKYHPRLIMVGISISLLTACLIVLGISLPPYVVQFYHDHPDRIYLFFSLGYIFSALILPGMGWIADKIGRVKQLAWTAGLFIFAGMGLFYLLHLHTLWALAVFIIIFHIFVASLANCYLSTLAEIFPTGIRFSGTAFCYNFIFCVAGFIPYVFIKFSTVPQGMYYIYIIFAGLSFLTLVSALRLFSQSPHRGALLNK